MKSAFTNNRGTEIFQVNILHVIISLQKAAGTSVFCGELCNGLVAMGHEITIAVTKPEADDCYPIDSRIKIISISSLIHCSTRATWSIIHIHALWAPQLHKVSQWAHANKIPVVWSPHGMMTPWAMHNKRLKKLVGWWLYQRWDLSRTELLHVTAESELEDVRRMGLKNKVVIAPLGVKICNCVANAKCADNEKVLLFVSRVQKKKGLVNLIKAWNKLPNDVRLGWKVRIVGPDQDNHTAELKLLCEELNVVRDFEFVGPKYGDELQSEYSSANLFVLPTYSENFGSVVIESLAHSVPVITTKGTPWQELEERKCGWWIDIGVEPLTAALKEAMALPEAKRREMGVCGRMLVEEKYTWGAVVRVMLKGYEDLLHG